jgi:RNA recognition motif-containing protein
MARFRCPSISSHSQIQVGKRPSHLTMYGNTGGSSKTAQFSKPPNSDENSKRCRSGIDLAKVKEIEMAKRRDMIRQRAKAKEFCHVYVGNIEPTIDESTLYQTFIHCGKISRIQIRCSRGAAVTIGRPAAASIHTSRDLQYATIEFTSEIAVRNALTLNGCKLHGARLLVTISSGDLPEVKDAIMRRVDRFQRLSSGPQPIPRRSARIQYQKTEPFIEKVVLPRATRPSKKGNILMGFNFFFPKCLDT